MEKEFIGHHNIFIFDFFSLFLKVIKNKEGVIENLEIIQGNFDDSINHSIDLSKIKYLPDLFKYPYEDVVKNLMEVARSITKKESVFIKNICACREKRYDLHVFAISNKNLIVFFYQGAQLAEKSAQISKKSDTCFSALNQLSTSANYMEGKIYEFIRELVQITSSALRLDLVSVWFLDEGGNQLRCFDCYDSQTNEHKSGSLLRKSQYLSAFSYLKDHSCLIIKNMQEEKKLSNLVFTFIHSRPVKSLLYTGIKKDGVLHGILCMEDTKNFRNWDRFDEDFGLRISEKISVVLGNFQRGLIRKNLMMSQARLESIFRSSPAAIGIIKNRVLVEVNASFSRITGYQPEEILGKSARILYPTQEEFERVGTEKYTQMHVSGVGTIETIWRHKNGRDIYVLLSSSYLDPFDFSMGSNFTATDITARVVAERKLRESEQRFQQISENIPCMIYQFMMDENGKFKNLYVNSFCKAIFGKSSEELIKIENVFAYIDPSYHQSLLSAIQKSAKDLSDWNCEFWIKTHKNERKYLKATSKPRRKGKAIIWNGFITDATAEKQSEELTRDLIIAKQSLEFKKKFLANMSHQIRTPLTAILGITDILENTQLSMKQKDLLHTLKISGMDLKQSIDEILDYAKIESGKIASRSVQFNIRDLLTHLKNVFDVTKQKPLNLLLDIPEKFPQQISTDKFRVNQVLHHLLDVIVKFSRQKKIIIRTEIVRLLAGNGILIKISLENNGYALEDDLTRDMLNPYKAGVFKDTDDLEDFQGTGLGMAISKEYVQILGGELSMNTHKGKVNKFSFTFRAKNVDSEKAGSDRQTNICKETKKECKPLNILLVDDKIVNQKVIKLMLEHSGHNVQLASNGKEAICKCETSAYDLILMDIKMPVMDGITATCQLKKKHTQLPPIVGLSANAFEGDREKYMNMGMDEYITKPLNMNDFERVVNKLFGNA
ncbi:MAG: PAS domain S-box protein [Bacteroidota bacterium]